MSSKSPSHETTLYCSNCGTPEAEMIAGEAWCIDCLQAKGSCCADEPEDEENQPPETEPPSD